MEKYSRRYPRGIRDEKTDMVRQRISTERATMEELQTATFINAVLGIVDDNPEMSNDELCGLIGTEFLGHNLATNKLITQFLDEKLNEIKLSNDQSYLGIMERAKGLLKIAGFLTEGELYAKAG